MPLHKLTSLYCRQQSQEPNSIHDRLLLLKPPRAQYPCRGGMYNEDVKEKAREAGEIIPSTTVATAFVRHV